MSLIKCLGCDLLRNGFHKNVFQTLTTWKYSTQSVTNALKGSAALNPLLSHGYSEPQCHKILSACPELARCEESELEARLKEWTRYTANKRFQFELFKTYPQLLLLPSRKVRDKMSSLAKLYSNNLVGKIIAFCPLVFVDPWEVIEEKHNYLSRELHFTSHDIVKSGSLNFPIEFIKERMEFLLRAGLYEIPDLKAPPGTSNKDNPKLKDILNSSEEVFSSDVAKLSPLEFQCFQALYAREIENES